MRQMTYLFYQYSRLRIWMEKAPRNQRWSWYGISIVWMGVFYVMLG